MITPEFLESVEPPMVFSPAPGIVSIAGFDSATVDMTPDRARYAAKRLEVWADWAEGKDVDLYPNIVNWREFVGGE